MRVRGVIEKTCTAFKLYSTFSAKFCRCSSVSVVAIYLLRWLVRAVASEQDLLIWYLTAEHRTHSRDSQQLQVLQLVTDKQLESRGLGHVLAAPGPLTLLMPENVVGRVRGDQQIEPNQVSRTTYSWNVHIDTDHIPVVLR